jgi:nucleoside-diphosphate-sugar epimerase
MSGIVLTGASGAVGRSVYRELTEHGHTTVTLGRRADIQWDLHDRLPQEAADAIRSADVVLHAAADIRLSETYENLYRVNVGALADIIGLISKLDRRPRLLYMSSAFADPGLDGSHNNGYERTKAEAESLVTASGLDASILRPSLVMGSRADGSISRFSGIYIFIRMLRLGLIPAIPGFSEVGVDLIPVDVVARETVAELENPSGRPVVAITSGTAAPSLEELVSTACDIFEAHGEPLDRPKFVTPDSYHRLFRPLVESRLSPAQRVMLETVEIFLPYFEQDHIFISDMRFSRAEIIDVWKKSIEWWLGETSSTETRGRIVWARKT